MSSIWIVLGVIASGSIGFLTFAMMQVAHDADRDQEIEGVPEVPQS